MAVAVHYYRDQKMLDGDGDVFANNFFNVRDNCNCNI